VDALLRGVTARWENRRSELDNESELRRLLRLG
jgi:hypothetical protein